jgi:hypothetical protein
VASRQLYRNPELSSEKRRKSGLKEIEAAINSDRSLFRPWRRDIETSVFIYETIRRPGRVQIPAAPSAAVIIRLEYIPSLSCKRARQQGGRLSLAGPIMAIRRPSVQLIVVIHPINYANGAKRLLLRRDLKWKCRNFAPSAP